jgi:hypothetical protein
MLGDILADLKDVRSKAKEKPQELAGEAKRRLNRVREDGEEKLWEFRTDALERAEDILGEAPLDMPIVSRIANAAERLVQKGLALPVEDYDVLNAKETMKRLADLSRVDVLRLRRHELANKQRKTVLAAMDRAL